MFVVIVVQYRGLASSSPEWPYERTQVEGGKNEQINTE